MAIGTATLPVVARRRRRRIDSEGNALQPLVGMSRWNDADSGRAGCKPLGRDRAARR